MRTLRAGRRPAARRRIRRASRASALRPACSAGTALEACWRSSGAGQAAGAAPLKVGAGAGGGHAHAPGRADGLLRAGRHRREHARLCRGFLGRPEQVGVRRDAAAERGWGREKPRIVSGLRGSERRRGPGAFGGSRCGDPRRVSGVCGPISAAAAPSAAEEMRASVQKEQLQHLAKTHDLKSRSGKGEWNTSHPWDGLGFGLGFWESCHAPYALGIC